MFKLSPTIYLSYVVPMDNLQLTAHILALSQGWSWDVWHH